MRRIVLPALVLALVLTPVASASQHLSTTQAKHAIRHAWSRHGHKVSFVSCKHSSQRRVVCLDVVAHRRGHDSAVLTQNGTVDVHRQIKRSATSVSRVIHYSTKVDPTFVQAPSNPLQATYAYTADATATTTTSTNQVQTTDLATTGDLPPGILNFYSQTTPGGPQSLFCSSNVGGSDTGASCPITYSDTGTYQVTTQYIPNGATATTQTDSEVIHPFSTTTTLSATQVQCGTGTVPITNSASGPWCEYTIANTVTDQNGTSLADPVCAVMGPHTSCATNATLSFTNGSEVQSLLVEAGGFCDVYISPGGAFSQGPLDGANGHCNVQGNSTGSATSWDVVASYAGKTGWSPSSSAAVAVTP